MTYPRSVSRAGARAPIVSKACAFNLRAAYLRSSFILLIFFFFFSHSRWSVLGFELVLRTFCLLVTDLHKQRVAWRCQQEDIPHCQSIHWGGHLSGSRRGQGENWWLTLGQGRAGKGRVRTISFFTLYVFIWLKLDSVRITFMTKKCQLKMLSKWSNRNSSLQAKVLDGTHIHEFAQSWVVGLELNLRKSNLTRPGRRCTAGCKPCSVEFGSPETQLW